MRAAAADTGPQNTPVRMLRRRLNLVMARRPAPVRLDRAIVSFTFDDFPKSAADAGAGVLEAAGARGTYYACAGLAGTTNHLGPLFDADDLARLVAAGHEIGCHTHGHRDLMAARTAEVRDEVERNAQVLAAMGLSEPLTSFAFPYGEATPAAKRLLASRFETLRAVRRGANGRLADRAYLWATPIYADDPGVDDALHRLAGAVRDNRWIVFYTHDVTARPGPYGCTPHQLEQVVAAAVDAGAEILPVRDAARKAMAEALGS